MKKISNIAFNSVIMLVLIHLFSAGISGKIIELDNGDKISWNGSYYDFRDSEGIKMIKLWIPPDTDPIRGIFISGHGGGGGDSRNFARDENIRAFAMRLGFAVAGLHNFPGRLTYQEGAEVFFDALNEFANLGFHPELSNIPFVMYGSSNGGSQAYGFVNYAPERAICFVANVSAGYVPKSPNPEALSVPGIFIMGKFDALIGKNGIELTKELLEQARKKGALWTWALELKGHEDGASFDIYMKLVEQAVKERYPQSADPRKGYVKLKKLEEANGWLTDFKSWSSGFAYIDSYENYKGNKESAGWLLNKDIAYVYRSLATHHNPLKIIIKEFDKTLNPYTDPGTMFSLGGPVIEPGKTIHISVETRQFPDWERINLYNGSEFLGSTDKASGSSISISLQKENLIYCLVAVAEGNESIYTSDPVHFFIKDTSLNWKRDLKIPKYSLKNTRSGSDNYFKELPPSKSDLNDSTLIAYALSEESEKQFSADDKRISEFWNRFNSEHDFIQLTQRENAKKGDSFNFVLTNDCNMEIKAAYGHDGIYLLFLINDDNDVNWPNELTGTEKEQFYSNFDAVDILIDSRSLEKIISSDPKETILFLGSGLTLTTKQYQIACGTPENRPNGLKRSTPDPWDFHSKFYSFDDAESYFGIEVENVYVDHYYKAQEWFIPWSELGFTEEPPAGKRFGFSGGFNDRDEGEHFPPGVNSSGGTVKASNGIRWIGNTDPWGYSKPPYAWGEIELGGKLK